MKLAEFKRIDGNWNAVFDDVMESSKDYVRISEYVEVEFTARKDNEQINEAVSKIDDLIESIKQDAMNKIEAAQTRKAELLALTSGE